MGVQGSYHGGGQPVAKAAFTPLAALQHKALVGVAATKRSLVACTSLGHAFSWGSGFHGELGQGHESSVMAPTALPLSPRQAQDPATLMMPPLDNEAVTAVMAGDSFIALHTRSGCVLVSGKLGDRYSGGVRTSMQLPSSVSRSVPPPLQLQQEAVDTATPCKGQSSRPTLLMDGVAAAAAGKGHLLLLPYGGQEVFVAGDASAFQIPLGAEPRQTQDVFPLKCALSTAALPTGTAFLAVHAYGDASVIEAAVPREGCSKGLPPWRCLIAWGAIPASMAVGALPLVDVASGGHASEWGSLGGDSDAADAADRSQATTEALPELDSFGTTVLSTPHVLRLRGIPQEAKMLGWWGGQLAFT
jgi:hypothetical protein